MPRDAGATRERLIDSGQQLFARSGVYATPLKKVVDAAGQRNPSALHYHFGGRSGLLLAIIDRHNSGIEERRRVQMDALDSPGLRDLVSAFVQPQSVLLASDEGREFLAIVGQLGDLFDRWDEDVERTPAQALRVLRAIESALPPELTADFRHERISRFLELVSEALAARARQLSAGRAMKLDDHDFAENLIDMCVGALSARAST
jgi:TetR/AcrR family transcriptional regulator, regulator of cefoperazone and chloramphenicol sensitivity